MKHFIALLFLLVLTLPAGAGPFGGRFARLFPRLFGQETTTQTVQPKEMPAPTKRVPAGALLPATKEVAVAPAPTATEDAGRPGGRIRDFIKRLLGR